MRILIYGINYAPELTGIGKYSGEMAEWLADSGHEVHVVTAPPYYPAWRVNDSYVAWRYLCENANGVSIWRCPLWIPRKLSAINRILHLLSFTATSFPVMLGQIFWRPDVVVVVEPPLFCSLGALFTAKLSRANAWLHVQDFEVDAAFDLGLMRSAWVRKIALLIERWLMLRFNKISTISPRMLDRLDDKDVPEAKRILFPNWVNTKLIFPLATTNIIRAELGIDQDEVVALYSGNMGQKQGLEIVIAAARLLESDAHLRFVMCGHGAGYEKLRNVAKGLKNIIWLPLQPYNRLNELLNMADIHLLPQRADVADLVMPSKLTGMLASGKPVIATSLQGTEVWSVVEGRGINVDPADVNAFTAAIKQLSQNPRLRHDMGALGRSYAEEYLSRDKVLSQFNRDLMEAVANK